jgi:hypothetical protein
MQNRKRQDGKPSRLDNERKERLEGLGFNWSPAASANVKWKLKFEELAAFKKVHRHCDVSQTSGTDRSLGRWVTKVSVV